MSTVSQKSQLIEEPKSFFDILSDVLLKKSNKQIVNTNTFKKHMSSYMLCRYLSMNDNLLPYVCLIQQYSGILSSEQFYSWCYDVIPKQRSGFIKYISKPKKVKEDENI